MIGLILAAGLGSRLLPLTESIPKPLLTLPDHTTMLDYQFSMLKKVGITRIVVVTGYLGQNISEHLKENYKDSQMQWEVINNPEYHLGSLQSLAVGLKSIDQSVLILNADHIFHTSIKNHLEQMLHYRHSSCMCDTSRKLNSKDAIVTEKNGLMMEISKKEPDSHIGYTGVLAIKNEDLGHFKESVLLAGRNDRIENKYYELAMNDFVSRGNKLQIHDIGNTKWVNVNTTHDLSLAHELMNSLP